MHKVTVVGAGMVGATTAMRLAEEGLAEVVLLDVRAELARGKALDISQALALKPSSSRVKGGGDYRMAEGSRVAVVAAGFPRKPGMSRADLLEKNAAVVRSVVSSLLEVAPDCSLLVVTNPLDEMTYLAWRITGWGRNRVLGMAGLLDGCRLAYFASQELGIPPWQVHPVVLGSHGDGMLPLARFTSVAGVPLTDLLPVEKLREVEDRTRKGGAEIVALLGEGSAYYAPSACVARMVRSILLDDGLQTAASVLLEGEYGLRDVFMGVPVVLGEGGWKEVVELPLNAAERKELEESAARIRENMRKLDAWLESP